MKPRAVFALQSPTLLNILHRSPVWDVSVIDMGDHPGQEAGQLEAPYHADGAVDHVFVCTPDHFGWARDNLPDAKLWWVLHNAQTSLIPDDIHPERAIALSRYVAQAHKAARPELCIALVSPAYMPEPIWKWGKDVWSMISRPSTRHPEHLQNVQKVRDLATAKHIFYGEGQPGGFLDPPRKKSVMGLCSAYLSAQPAWSGFGLAEHECFAAGVPVVGSRWGDTPAEMPLAYFGLVDGAAKQAAALRSLATIQAEGERLSRVGLAYTEKYRTPERMNKSIQALLDGETL